MAHLNLALCHSSLGQKDLAVKILARAANDIDDDALKDPFLEQTLKIPQDFISEMKEAFRYFDKVQPSLLIKSRKFLPLEWKWVSERERDASIAEGSRLESH